MAYSGTTVAAALGAGFVAGAATYAVLARERASSDAAERDAKAKAAAEAAAAGAAVAAEVDDAGALPGSDRVCGEIKDLVLRASLPFELKPTSYSHEHGVPALAAAYGSATVRSKIEATMRSTVVEGLEEWKVCYRDIVDMILGMGRSRVYVFGGFLRDLTVGKISDDMDFLFRSRSGSVVAYLNAAATSKGWPVYRKMDEHTGEARWDFIAIGRKGAKGKFSGHPIGSGCEGDFACNTLLFDCHSGALIDPTGHGIADAIDFVLRIPFPEPYWDQWLNEDRLPGMKLLRYYNFVGRGYSPCNDKMRSYIVDSTKEIFADRADQATVATTTFLKRKVFEGSVEKAKKKESSFRAAVVREFVAAGHTLEEARAWYDLNVFPLYGKVKKNSVTGMVDAMRAVARAESSHSAP